MGRVYLVLQVTAQLPSKMAASFFIPTSKEWEFLLLYTSPVFGIVYVLDFGSSVIIGMGFHLTSCSDWHFPDNM